MNHSTFVLFSSLCVCTNEHYITSDNVFFFFTSIYVYRRRRWRRKCSVMMIKLVLLALFSSMQETKNLIDFECWNFEITTYTEKTKEKRWEKEWISLNLALLDLLLLLLLFVVVFFIHQKKNFFLCVNGLHILLLLIWQFWRLFLLLSPSLSLSIYLSI